MEADIYAEAMGITAQFIDATPNRDDFNSLTAKRMLGAATHSFNLLCSAWDSMLTGRYGAAASHQRSINETPDLLVALYTDPGFADRMSGKSEDMNEVRRILRDAHSRAGNPEAKTFIDDRRKQLKPLHVFSHLTFEATGIGLGVGVLDGKKVGVLRAGGAPSERSLVGMARILALDAVELAATVAVVLADDDLEHGSVNSLVLRTKTAFDEQLNQDDLPDGEIDKLFLLRSDEAPADPDRVQQVES